LRATATRTRRRVSPYRATRPDAASGPKVRGLASVQENVDRAGQTFVERPGAVLPPLEQPITRGDYKNSFQYLCELKRLHVGANLAARLPFGK
jgi:hypothetical protein